ncbi:MAG: hemolysin family protein [Phycisphaerae bacterium]|nr:hemolysin family protein [Phycisphaerae bacterium]
MLTIGEFLVEQVWQVGLLCLLLVASAYFAGAETALFSLSRSQLYRLERDARRSARLAATLMRSPESVLTTVLLGTNIVNILYFVVSTMLIIDVRSQVRGGEFWAIALAFVTFVAMVITAEIIPKTLAHIWAWRLAPSAAPILAVLNRSLKPIQRALMTGLINPLTRLLAPAVNRRSDLAADEMSALLNLSQKRGLISADDGELLQEVLELTDRKASDIMAPRVDIVACDVNSPAEELLELVRRKRINRVPVYEGDLDHIIGVVYVKHLLADSGLTLRAAAGEIRFVPESAPLERLLVHFRATGSQLAVVVDEYGGTAGLVTLEDVLEEIVGEITEGMDHRPEPVVRQAGPGQWLVDADLPIHEWTDAFPTDLTGARFNTVGGFVVSLLGHIPSVGDQAEYRNVTFTVEEMRRRRIALLRVQLREGRE